MRVGRAGGRQTDRQAGRQVDGRTDGQIHRRAEVSIRGELGRTAATRTDFLEIRANLIDNWWAGWRVAIECWFGDLGWLPDRCQHLLCRALLRHGATNASGERAIDV